MLSFMNLWNSCVMIICLFVLVCKWSNRIIQTTDHSVTIPVYFIHFCNVVVYLACFFGWVRYYKMLWYRLRIMVCKQIKNNGLQFCTKCMLDTGHIWEDNSNKYQQHLFQRNDDSLNDWVWHTGNRRWKKKVPFYILIIALSQFHDFRKI